MSRSWINTVLAVCGLFLMSCEPAVNTFSELELSHLTPFQQGTDVNFLYNNENVVFKKFVSQEEEVEVNSFGAANYYIRRRKAGITSSVLESNESNRAFALELGVSIENDKKFFSQSKYIKILEGNRVKVKVLKEVALQPSITIGGKDYKNVLVLVNDEESNQFYRAYYTKNGGFLKVELPGNELFIVK